MLAAAWFWAAASLPAAAQADTAVFVLTYEGPVTPAMESYLERGIDESARMGAEALIFTLDTPGGSVDITRRIIQTIEQSPVPIIVYVAPSRAWAASAGTLITLAGHLSAMAPETLIGAASPVGSGGEDLPEVASRKATEAVAAMARSLASRRGEDVVKWAEETVVSAEASTAKEALAIGAIDVIAEDVDDLLQQLDGSEVTVRGEKRVLHLADADVVDFPQNLFEQLLVILSNPAVAVLLLTLGLNAILYELSAPGGYVAGAVGVISLLLAFYSLGLLEANLAGLAFVAIAFALFAIELKVQTGGALAAAGVAAFVLGMAMLFASSFVAIPWAAILGAAAAMGLFVLFALQAVIRGQRRKPFSGGESLIGARGRARSRLDPDGMVFLQGTLWEATAEGDDLIEKGEFVRVTRREGHHLWVKSEG